MPPHRRVGSAFVDEELVSIESEDASLKRSKIRRCTYNDRNHFSVLTQAYGSVWPKVLRFCIINMVLTIIVFYTTSSQSLFTFDPTGHKFMALILSFLVVTRCKIAVSRYMESMGYLTDCYRSCRELVQYMCVLTQEDKSEGATIWRHNCAYRTIILLRVTMSAIEYESKKSMPWEIPELSMVDEQEIRASVNNSNTLGSKKDECFRAPVLLSYALRKELMEHRTGAYLKEPFRHVNEELKLQDCVTDFMKAFHGLRKLIETPFPFPLVQMTRTFLVFWVFSLPFVLCHDPNQYPFDALVVVFMTTFGFIGIEYVSMELDDPFGDDPNDFDDLGMAQLVFEDIYIAIYKCDGEKNAYKLRKKIVARMKRGSELQNYHQDYQNRYSPVHEDDVINFDRRDGGMTELSDLITKFNEGEMPSPREESCRDDSEDLSYPFLPEKYQI